LYFIQPYARELLVIGMFKILVATDDLFIYEARKLARK